ncbi:beta,beta-carotene 15,15'-dioxygenase [Caerostris extrusa]|uniref:Beta,beta-carotene 15,15'-dioxygenase n=1 Tax=Caerostris extrusa TaxID=172846 RepID=A0AAV4QL21_CAEEX|nr:beta,beta-carotene 15,15'-dioxygenase [Caerostris extrusa]
MKKLLFINSFHKFASLFSLDDLTDNDLVSIILYADEAYACSESNCIWRIDPDTLESLQKYLSSLGTCTEPFREKAILIFTINNPLGKEVTERWLNLDLETGVAVYLGITEPHKKSDNGFQNASLICKIPSTKTLGISYHHSFGMSANYFIFVEQPLYLSIPRLMWSHFVAGTYADAMYWDDDRPTRFHVVRRSDNQLLDTVYVSKGFFVFHHINAYEEDNHLIVDMCVYEQGEVVKTLYIKALEDLFNNPKKYSEPFVSRGKRFILPLNVDEKKGDDENLITLSNSEATAVQQPDGSIYLKPEILTASEPWSPELPRINYDYNGRKYKYFYAMARNDTLERTHIIKVDVTTQKTISWSEKGAIPSEPVFISEPGLDDQAEDSGILIASLLFSN